MTAACVGWIAGTAWHLQSQTLHSPQVYAICFAAGLLALGASGLVSAGRRTLVRRRPSAVWWTPSSAVQRCLRSLWVASLAASLALSVCGWRAALQAAQRLSPHLEGQDLILQGVVAQLPDLNSDGVRFHLTVEQAWREADRAGGRASEAVSLDSGIPTQVLLGWRSGGEGAGLPPVRAGERWYLPVRLKAPHGQFNPHGFDFEGWLWSQGVMAVGQVRVTSASATQPRRLAQGVAHPVEQWRQACRDRLWQQGLDARLAGVLSALLLGDQAAIDPLDWDVFRRTGVAHLMSISGLHITLLAALARWVFSALWTRATWRRQPWTLWQPASEVGLWGGWGVAVAYALFSGWGLPAQRTVIMLGTAVLLRVWGTPWPWPATWVLACALVLAWDPWAWLQAGFWLSFVAVGLLMALDDQSAQRAAVCRTLGPRPNIGRIRSWLAAMHRATTGLWREQWIMTLGLAPLTLLLFHEVSPLGWLANLVAIPWVTLCITPLALLGVVWPMAWHGGAGALAGLQGVLSALVGWGVPAWSVPVFPVWVGVAGLVGAALLCWRGPGWLRCWGLPLVLPVVCWQPDAPPAGEVAVVVADVGQGQAVLVRTAHHVLLYDAGPRYAPDVDAGQRVVVPLLHSLGWHLDRLVLSHRDTDHTGGAQAVLAKYPNADVLGSLPSHWPQAGHPGYQDCQAGQRWTWDGVLFEVLHPDVVPPVRSASNAWSCVVRIQAAGASVLLTGDIEAPEEAALIRRLGGEVLRADVLLVPHHGSKTSSSAAFLDQVQPRWAWVQAGYRNRFGHPAREVLARYEERRIAVIETARCGAIRWSSQSPVEMSCERESRLRYWHHRVP